MRVFFNALQADNKSGTGRYCIELLKALATQPTVPELVVAWPKGMPLPVPKDIFHYHYHSALNLPRLYFNQRGFQRLCDRMDINMLHYPSTFIPAFTSYPTLVTVHDLAFLRNSRWFPAKQAAYYHALTWHGLPKAKRILADSECTAADLRDHLRIPEDRIQVVPLGVDRSHFRPASESVCAALKMKYRLPERFFLYAGTLEPRKNLARLVRAWSRIAEESDYDLVLAGRWGWKYSLLKKAIKNSPHRKRIHLPGFIPEEDLPALMSAAQGFVYPSLYEGFGLPPLEAMACGTPVLVSNSSSLPEVVGDAGILVDPEDTEAIAAGLIQLAQEETHRIQAGLARAKSFTWQQTAQAVAQAYRDVAG